MDQERLNTIRREREAAAATSNAPFTTSQYARGDAASRSTMAKLFPGMPLAPSGVRRPMVMDSDGYARRSEPSLSKNEIPRYEAKSDAADGQFELLRLRRSMPSASHGRAADDLAWAHDSLKQSEHRSTASSSTSSGSSGMSMGMGIVSRCLTSPPEFMAGNRDASATGRASAYQLQRAHTADVLQRTDSQALGDVTQLRQQVVLLRRSLEEEKKRRVMEQKLMQDKILELQGLIRHNMPEQKRELERNLSAMRTPAVAPTAAWQQPALSAAAARTTPSQAAGAVPARVRALRSNKQLQQAQERSPYKTMKLLSEMRPEQIELDDGTDDENADVEDDGDEEEDAQRQDDVDLNETKERRKTETELSNNNNQSAVRAVESRMAQELTKLRARMRAVVLEAQNEVKALNLRLEDEQKIYERKERQLRMESSLRVTSLEERHNYAKKKLLAKTSLLSTQVAMLTDENEKLQQEVQAKDDRIRQLELALGGRRIMESSKPHPQKASPQQLR